MTDPLSSADSAADWPTAPVGLLIMGKRQGTKRENKQLWGRAAMAAALWYSAPHPKPYILFVASDIHGPQRTPDAEVVKSLLVDRFGLSADYILLRQRSNCTLIEVRVARVLSRVYHLGEIIALTHAYHAPRTKTYLSEVLPNSSVIPVHPLILNEITFPEDLPHLLEDITQLIQDSQPSRLDLMRETLVETLLTLAHRLDSRGRVERVLAHILRPGAY